MSGQLEVVQRTHFAALRVTTARFVCSMTFSPPLQGVRPVEVAAFWTQQEDRWIRMRGFYDEPRGHLELTMYEELTGDGGSLAYYTPRAFAAEIEAMRQRLGAWIDELLNLYLQRLPAGEYTLRETPSVPRTPAWTWLRT